jgi:glutamate formiminotransferase/formiminotetrahydrofolate cyclodeaminase
LKSEIVGLVPERAIVDAGAGYLRLPDAAEHLLESKIREQEGPSLDGWIADLASAEPVPGGGSAAAFAGTMAAALIVMVSRLTLGGKAYAGVEPRIREILAEVEQARTAQRAFVEADAAAYVAVMAAYRIPKATPDRVTMIDNALLEAARVPLAVARGAARLIVLAGEVGAIGNKKTLSDARTAEYLARAALGGALENVRINLASLSDPSVGRDIREEMQGLEPADPGATPRG